MGRGAGQPRHPPSDAQLPSASSLATGLFFVFCSGSSSSSKSPQDSVSLVPASSTLCSGQLGHGMVSVASYSRMTQKYTHPAYTSPLGPRHMHRSSQHHTDVSLQTWLTPDRTWSAPQTRWPPECPVPGKAVVRPPGASPDASIPHSLP